MKYVLAYLVIAAIGAAFMVWLGRRHLASAAEQRDTTREDVPHLRRTPAERQE